MIATIKNEIKTQLDALVSSNDLGGATITDIKKDPLDYDIASYPHAFLMPPAMESSILDNRSNIREYSFEIIVMVKADNLSNTTELEETMEAIFNKFDNNPTLTGTALAGISPTSTSPEPIRSKDKDLIIFSVILKARELVDLTFGN